MRVIEICSYTSIKMMFRMLVHFIFNKIARRQAIA